MHPCCLCPLSLSLNSPLLASSSVPLRLPSTSAPFKGNPAGVCYLPSHTSWSTVSAAWMQSVALEMNQAETAFLLPSPPLDSSSSPSSSFLLRWFTPAAEVDLCGHATLASSHFLFTHHVPTTHAIHFSTRSGLLTARVVSSSTPSPSPLIEISLPTDPPVEVSPKSEEYAAVYPVLLSSLHLPSSPTLPLWKGKFDYLVELPDAEAVMALRPDFSALKAVQTRGMGVTARGGPEAADFVSRFFAPALGIDEDPVTGSAHCMLADYWGPKLGKGQMVGYQASARGGVVRVKKDGERVRLQGHAVQTMKGQLLV